MTEEQKKEAVKELESLADKLEEIYLKYGLDHISIHTSKSNRGNLCTMVSDTDRGIDIWRKNRETQK